MSSVTRASRRATRKPVTWTEAEKHALVARATRTTAPAGGFAACSADATTLTVVARSRMAAQDFIWGIATRVDAAGRKPLGDSMAGIIARPQCPAKAQRAGVASRMVARARR